MRSVADLVAERVRRAGPMRFDQVMELALYHPELGFFETGGQAGRDGGDFITSPEVGPLFGETVAGALDGWWDRLGQPDPFVVVEAGAGAGTLAASILAARPACAPALRYLLVDRSAALRRQQSQRLDLEPAGLVLGPVATPDPDVGPVPVPGAGPLAASLPELPAGPYEGVVLANELLDNLPFRLLERHNRHWREVFVTENLTEELVEAPPDLAAEADFLSDGCPESGRIPLQHAAGEWLRSALGFLSRGRVVVFDYADTTASMCRRPWTQWVRTHRRHGPGASPLEHLGDQDLTCEVAIDQMSAVKAITRNRSQAEFLAEHGIGSLVDAARGEWQERAHIGDLSAMKARSRVNEGSALTDPTGLGSFRVLEWEVPAPVSHDALDARSRPRA